MFTPGRSRVVWCLFACLFVWRLGVWCVSSAHDLLCYVDILVGQVQHVVLHWAMCHTLIYCKTMPLEIIRLPTSL